MATRNVAIMFTDIKGYTARVSEGTRNDLTHLRAVHDRLLTPVFEHFEGRIVQTLGDAFLVYFLSPTDAVMCGIAIQEVLRKHNLRAGESEKMDIRVAINSGEVEITDEGVMGEAVNLAARVESIAEAGEVWFTEAVYLAMNRTEAPSSQVGERTFKGIPYPVRVYRSTLEMNKELAQRMDEGVRITDKGPILRGLHRGESEETKRSFWQLAGALSAAAVVLLVGFLFFASDGMEDDIPLKEIERLALIRDPERLSAAVVGLLERVPGATVSYLAARALEDVEGKHSSLLYREALKRGHEANDEIFQYVIGHLVRYSYTDWATNDDLRILKDYYTARSRKWLEQRLDESLNHEELLAASKLFWAVGEKAAIDDPYYENFFKFANLAPNSGSHTIENDSEETLAVFREQTDPQRRRRILQLYRWKLEYLPTWKKKWHWNHGDTELAPRLKQGLQQLEADWGS